jgi:hypothetical protein
MQRCNRQAEVGMPRKRRQELDVSRLTRILEDDQACRDLRLYFESVSRGENFRRSLAAGSNSLTVVVTELIRVIASPPRTSSR